LWICAECGEARRIAVNKKAGAMVEEVDAIVNAEPGQRLAGRKGTQRGGGLKEGAAFVGEIACGKVAGGSGGLDFREELRKLVWLAGDADAEWVKK
jgi:hypothetical protein